MSEAAVIFNSAARVPLLYSEAAMRGQYRMRTQLPQFPSRQEASGSIAEHVREVI
jgi:hypothetical protein